MKLQAVVILIVGSFFVPLPSEAFWAMTGDGGTHQKLTKHAIEEISEKEFPDIHMYAGKAVGPFATGIYKGARNEDSHNHRWRGNWAFWEKQAIAAYELNLFDEAYERIGNAVHLYQDDEVPAHQKYCFHGLGTGFYPYVDMPAHGGLGNPDQLENFALLSHKEIPNGNGWDRYYKDLTGVEWKYWLNDAEDADVGIGGWGAYGKAKNQELPVTTDNELDWYMGATGLPSHPEIAWSRLFDAVESIVRCKGYYKQQIKAVFPKSTTTHS